MARLHAWQPGPARGKLLKVGETSSPFLLPREHNHSLQFSILNGEHGCQWRMIWRKRRRTTKVRMHPLPQCASLFDPMTLFQIFRSLNYRIHNSQGVIKVVNADVKTGLFRCDPTIQQLKIFARSLVSYRLDLQYLIWKCPTIHSIRKQVTIRLLGPRALEFKSSLNCDALDLWLRTIDPNLSLSVFGVLE